MKDRIAKVKEDNSLSTRFLNWQSRDLNWIDLAQLDKNDSTDLYRP